jgi:predicted MFS family arabinose efflux permease
MKENSDPTIEHNSLPDEEEKALLVPLVSSTNDKSTVSSEVNRVLTFVVKRGTTAVNVMAIPIIFFVISNVLFFANTLLPLLLESPDYFAIDSSVLGTYTSYALFWAQLGPCLLLPVYAFIFEMVERRIPIAFALVTTCMALYAFPRVAPNYNALVFLRALIGLNNNLVISCPLITDCIKKESRGRAISL